jgi:hypothetical protein
MLTLAPSYSMDEGRIDGRQRQASVGDHEYACMHDLMMHLRDEPQERYSNIYLAVFSC